jgi:ribosomal protein S18 acetylase RimI-like enzyme
VTVDGHRHPSSPHRCGSGQLWFRVDDCVTDEDAVSLWPVYDAVFHDRPDRDDWRAAVWDKHSVRAGFRLARAYDGEHLIGFAYGYEGQPGQWWTDNARTVLAPEVADAWLGGHFELVSIGVLDRARGAGVGRELLCTVTEGLSYQRCLLMTTADESDPARRLYASDGWRVIGPGIGESQVIMAKRMP